MNADFNINGKIIETERLILRAFKESDLNDFYEYASVPGVGEMAGWSCHKSIDESKNILNIFIKGDITFAIYHKGDQKVIGSIGVENLSNDKEMDELKDLFGRELGFVLSKDYWGNGLMGEALLALIDYLFTYMNLDFLMAGYFTHNIRSKRVQGKSGFKPFYEKTIRTRMGTLEDGIVNILYNPNRNIRL